jgi:hypothetical protein
MHRFQRFCLDHLSYNKMAAFEFYLQPGKTNKSRLGGHDSPVVFFCQTFHFEKKIARSLIGVMQQSVHLSPKFGAKSSHIFKHSP